MFQRPRFKAHLRVDLVPPDLLIVRSDDGHHALRGRLLPEIAPLLDGRRSLGDLARELDGRANVLDLHFGISLLEEEDLLEEASAPPPARSAPGAPPPSSTAPLGLQIQTLGELPGEALAKALTDLGLEVVPSGDLLLALTDDYLRPELAEIDREARRGGRRWLPLQSHFPLLWLGPELPREGRPCWHCLERRLEENRPFRRWIEEHGRTLQMPARDLRPEGLRLAAEELARCLAEGEDGDLREQLLTVDLRSGERLWHSVVALPDCPACGHGPLDPTRPPAPVPLRARPRRSDSDGGYRVARARDTVERLSRHVSPLTGIVGRLRPHGLGVVEMFIAEHLFRSDADPRDALASGKYHKSAGKGIHPDQARASALCEAIERYCGLFRGDESRRRATLRELGEAAVQPNDCMLYSPRQIRERESWNAAGERYLWVPVAFDEERPVEWTALWSLTEERFRYLPTAYCYYSYPLPENHRFCFADSNGNAAGTCREEAILQGFLELVERDCVALWWYHRLRRPGVDLESFGEPYFARLRAEYHRLERRLWVLDVTNDLGLPTFVAVSRDAQGRHLLGFGTHLDARIAVARSLTEVSQFLRGAVAGREQRVFSSPPERTGFLEPDPTQPQRRAGDYPAPPEETLDRTVGRCVDLARAQGLETLVLDQSRPGIDLSVVRVVVPGLRHFWARLAPGRLYEVPQRLGWIGDEPSEAELNPSHLLI